MKHFSLISILGVAIVTLAACGKPQVLSADRLVKYVEEEVNGLRQETKVGDWVYTFQYKPADYIIALEARGEPSADFCANRRRQLAGTASYNISFRNEVEKTEPLRVGVADIAAYNERLNYYLNQAPDEIRLISGGDTLVPSGYVFEPNYNMSPEQRMVVSFILPPNKTGEPVDQQIIFTDKIFNNGIIKAGFRGKDIVTAPALKI